MNQVKNLTIEKFVIIAIALLGVYAIPFEFLYERRTIEYQKIPLDEFFWFF